MEVDPQVFFGELIQYSKDEKKGPFECSRLVEILNRFLVEEQVNSSLIDLYLIYIFDKSSGLIYFVNSTIRKKNFKNAVVKSVEILYTLVTNFPRKLVENNIVDLFSLCINIIKLDVHSEIKVKTLDLLVISIDKLDAHFESDEESTSYKQVLDTLQNVLRQKHSDTVKQKELIALGFFVKKYDYFLEENQPKELYQIFIKHFQEEMIKAKKSQYVFCGFFTGFSYYCECFPLDKTNDRILIQRLYECLKTMVSPLPTDRVKVGYRAALLFLSKNGRVFGELLLRDYIFWHSKLLNWLNMGEDCRKVGVTTLRAYFEIISKVLYEKTDGDFRDVVKYFNKWCQDILKKEQASSHETRLAVQCLRIFSSVSYKYLSHNEATDLFLMVMQKFEYDYVLNYNPESEVWEYLPYYVQTIANLMQFKTFISSEFYCLQRAVINMIKSFHQLPYSHHDLVVVGVVTTCFYLKETQYFDVFVENIVYQGVLWACSHEHISKSEFSEATNDRIITVKSFFPLWRGILRLVSNREYDKYGLFLEDRKYIFARIVNQLVKTLMILINKLNVSIQLKEGENTPTDIAEAYQVAQTNDYAIFLNVTDFYQEVLNNIEPRMFKKCICMVIKHIINKCVEFPLISGFYNLLSYNLRIANKLDMFVVDRDKQDVVNTRETLTKFMEILLDKMVQYKDELLKSYLQVLLECPVVIIKDMLPACVVPFSTIFSVGRSYLPLAKMGLNTLEHWQDNIDSKDLNVLLTQVVPSLDSYLRSKSLQGQTRSNFVEKRRKTAQVMKKRKVIVELEPELIKLQKRILSFIGKQNAKICRAFANSENVYLSSSHRESLQLKLTLPYEDIHVDIYLDPFVLRVVNLALYCSDRKTRVTACELLQAIVMVLLGSAKSMSESGLSELNNVLKTIGMPLLQLGCDIDQLVEQIFAPLFLQLIHWYSSPKQLKSAHTGIIVDVIMEGITHPTDSRLRDFSGKCVNEFVKWTIKQTNEANLANDPINIKILVNKMRFFGSHPHPAKKLGAALIFNNIYREIREEESLISIFWIEIFYIFVTNLSLMERNFTENDIVTVQTRNALRHLQRVFIEKPEIFRSQDDKRKVPSDIPGGSLKDIAVWLFNYTGNKSRSCREECMDLFIKISPLTGKKINLAAFVEENFTDNFVSNIYEKFILTHPTPVNMTYSEDCTVLLKWMQGLLCMLDGYNFVIKNNLGDINFSNNDTFAAVEYFLENVQSADLADVLKLINDKPWTFTSLDRETFNNEKAVCVLSILKFYASVMNSDALCEKADILWTPNFWTLILNAVFNPHLLGLYDRVNRPRHTELLILLLNVLPKKIPADKLLELTGTVRDYIGDRCFTTIDLDKNIPLVQRNLMKGLLLLGSTIFNEQLNVSNYSVGLVDKLVNNFFVLQKDNVIFLRELQETAIDYCELVLEFSLTNKNEFTCLVNHLYQTYTVQSMGFNKEVSFGIFFLSTFTEAVTAIVKDFDCFLNISIERGNMDLTLELVMFLLNYIKKTAGCKKYRSAISKTLEDNWDVFKGLFESSPEKKHLGIEYLKLLIPLCKLQATEINVWLTRLLTEEPDVNSKLEIFYLIIQTTDETQGASPDLEVGLSDFSKHIFLLMTSDSAKNAHLFHKMATNTPLIKSNVIVKFFVELYSILPVDVDIAPLLVRFEENSTETLQQHTLNLVYKSCCDNSIAFENRYKIMKKVIPPVFQVCKLSAFEKFYEEHINDIISNCDMSDNTQMQILYFVLVELLFLRIPVGSSERTDCSISSAANKPRLLQYFVKFALNAFRIKTAMSDSLLRLYKCHAYNALASIVSNSLKSESFYEKLFMRQEGNTDILWSGIVDTGVVYDFPISFQSIPSQRKILVNIRDEIRAQQNNLGGRSSSVKYLESQRLFNSSLTEDVTEFDFTSTMLRSQSEIEGTRGGSVNCQREIELEEVSINDHECMATICGLIQHIFDSRICELPESDEEDFELPNYFRGIRTTLLSPEAHRNVKIFLVKVIDNTINIFNYYAKWFLEPLLQFIVDKIAGSTTNYFITDVIIILSRWAPKIVTLNDKESKLASDMLSFLISNLKTERVEIFKYNLDLIKLIVESWKCYIQVPADTIFTLISSENTSVIGMQLISVFLVNKLPPWREDNREAFLNMLLKRMDSSKKQVYRTCSEAIGLVLQHSKSEQHKQQVDTYLMKISDFDKYVRCLEGVAIHFSPIIGTYHISKLISSLNQISDVQKILHLKLIHRRVEVSLDILEETSDFKMVDWDRLLEVANLEIQIITLQIIKRCVTVFMNYNCYVNIIRTFSRNVTNVNATYRSNVYDIAMLVCQQNRDITDMCKDILIYGLVDHDADNREKVIKFWAENSNVPDAVVARFPYLLSNLYKSKVEDQFLGYVNYFLVSALRTCDKYDSEIFQHPLEDCNFEEYRLQTHWRQQHPSVVPLFAETLQSSGNTLDLDDSHLGQLRKTQTSFAFAPTESVHEQENSKFVSLESSLTVGASASTSTIKNPNELILSERYRIRKRFLRDKSKISTNYANYEVKKQVKRVQQRFDMAKEGEKKVTVYRKYRKGDFPDIQISLSSVLLPLQMLSLQDSEVSKVLFTEIFKGLAAKVQNNDSFISTVSNGIRSIFENSIYFNPNVFSTMLDILLKNKEKIQFEPQLISYVCQQSGLISVGTLILEEYITGLDDLPNESKRGTAAEQNREIALWVKLAELYKGLEEWDMVRSIFLEKMSCKDVFQEAIKYESNGHWRTALELYEELIKTDMSPERKDFYYESYFKCFANLGEWEKLPETIKSVVVSTENENVWDKLWDNGWCQQKLLPWYITAQVRNIINQDWSAEFAENINKCLSNAEKTDYLQTHFSEELCMMWILKKDVPLASFYLQSYIKNFLGDWQLLNPFFSSLRYNKILALRNVMEIDEFISAYNRLSDDFREPLKTLTSKWKTTSKEILPSIILSETRLLYRTLFIDRLKEKILSESTEYLGSIKTDLIISFIDTATELNNYYLSKKYLVKYNKKDDLKFKLAYGNVAFAKSKLLTDHQEELKTCFIALDIFNSVIEASQDQYILLAANLKYFEIVSRISTILKSNEECFTENQTKLRKILKCEINSSKDIDRHSIGKLRSVIENFEDDSMDDGRNERNIALQDVANGFVKLARFTKDQNDDGLQGDFILYVLRAMKLNSLEAKQLFPCILMQSRLGADYRDLFIAETENIPTWMFLGWIPQLLANVDSESVYAISRVIIRIAEAYPQAIMYPYRLSKENYSFRADNVAEEARHLIDSLDRLLLQDEMVDKFLKALTCVSVPAATLRYYVVKMVKDTSSINSICNFVLSDMFEENPRSDIVTNMHGNIYKKIHGFKKDFEKVMGTQDVNMLRRMNVELKNVLDNDKPVSKLKDYCPWLANFSANKLNILLEIPGQYTGQKLPLPQYHVKISGFSTNVQVMGSLRKPIKLTILGMDTKEYPFLIKFGEDIRQDQRIEQLFTLMNDIFNSSTSCIDHHILTYQVIPLTSNLGMIQWINDAETLFDFILKFSNNKVTKKDLKMIDNGYAKHLCKATDNLHVYGKTAMKYNRDRTIVLYRSLVNMIPLDIMRTSFWSLSIETENYIALKNNFIKSYAALCTGQWILGIGDRHLKNSMICTGNGKVLGIDFGHAFGTATQILPVPELVPFRLTPHIISFMEPLKERGQFRQSMIHCLKSLRSNNDSLLATMDVFIKEPSLDWLEHASKFENGATESIRHWYPNKKVDQTRRKLQGASSTKILIEDLNDGQIIPQYTAAYIKLVEGSPEIDLRAKMAENFTVEHQVDCLIDHATDYNLLGRMYAGWAPWV